MLTLGAVLIHFCTFGIQLFRTTDKRRTKHDMSLITAILQCHNSTPDNAGIIELVETLDNFRMKIREIETPKTGVEVTVEMNTDAPIHDEDDALRAVYEALAGLAIEVRTVVRGLCRFDEVAVDEFDAMEQRNADRYLLSI